MLTNLIIKSPHIQVSSDIMSGQPVFAGTRVPVQCLFDNIDEMTTDEFIEHFPTVTRQQVLGVLAYANQVILEMYGG